MIVAIHQPQYLPWLGYFDKILTADAFCFLDNVQFKKNEWQNRNRIKTSQGWQWLSVPVTYRFPQKISEVGINNRVDWRRKHMQALISSYGKAPFFQGCIGVFEAVYARDWQMLYELNICLVEEILKLAGIENKMLLKSSDLNLCEDPTLRLIDICRAAGGDTYLSGRDGAKYMDLKQFEQNGIRVIFQDFQHPEYSQLFGDFQANLSIVDLLFNCGPESLKKVIQNG